MLIFMSLLLYMENSGNAGVNKDHVLINDVNVIGESSGEPSVKKGSPFYYPAMIFMILVVIKFF